MLSKRVNVALVGAGGNGSQMLTGLARLDRAMRSLGHPGGLHVDVIDYDLVTEANVGRQLFSFSDLGLPKAVVLIHRVNLFFGVSWRAIQRRAEDINLGVYDIVIGCVDSRRSRKEIMVSVEGKFSGTDYWLDIGNKAADGQVVLGEPRKLNCKKKCSARLPTVAELFPEIIDESLDGKDNGPSCSLAEALSRQELFINQAVVTHALDILWRLFRYGKISHHGVFVNLESGRTTPLPVDKEVWKRLKPKKARSKKLKEGN